MKKRFGRTSAPDPERRRCRTLQRVLDGDGPLPPAAADWPRPVLGYTGTIHPDRVDVASGRCAGAAHLPQGTVALVGPNFLTGEDQAAAGRCANVVLTGPVPYAELPEYMRAFDVCITPHRVTPFTESLNPIKLWEYLAAGKPIVATDVAGFRDYPQFVRIAPDADGFAAGRVGKALGESRAAAEARRARKPGAIRGMPVWTDVAGCLRKRPR